MLTAPRPRRRADLATVGQKLRYREETQTQPDGSLVYRNLVPTGDGGEFEMIRTTYRQRR